MFTNFESLTSLPKPFAMFQKKSDDETDAQQQQQQQQPLREGMTPKTSPAAATSTTDDVKKQNSFFYGMMSAIFFILFVIIGITYYFNSSALLINQLFAQPFYERTNFWNKFKSNMVGSKLTIFLVIWMVVFCCNLLLMDTVFQNHDYTGIFYTTTFFYWGIVGITMLIIGNIPSLVDVFENTIGVAVLSTPLFNLSKTMSIFKNRNFKSSEYTLPNDFLITTFDIPGFHDYFDDLVAQYPDNAEFFGGMTAIDTTKTDFYIDLHMFNKREDEIKALYIKENRPNENLVKGDNNSLAARKELLHQVLTKNTIGHFMWVLLASYITVLMTINTLTQ